MFAALRPTAIVLCLILPGCFRPKSDRPPTYPVAGSLIVQGKPAAGARVQLNALDAPALERLCPHAEVGSDGAFCLTTFKTNDGAPEGIYALTVTWPMPPPPGREEAGPDRFKKRYADPLRPVRLVTIIAGDNVLEPIRLP